MLLNKILCKNYVKLGKNCANKTKKQTKKPKKKLIIQNDFSFLTYFKGPFYSTISFCLSLILRNFTLI